MAEKKLTVYQKLQKVLATGSVQSLSSSNSYNIHQPHQTNDVVDIARSPQEKEFKVLQAKQQKLMARQWYRAQQDINNQSLAGLNDVRLMYRDVDLMDTMPEIGAAMDLVSEECCYVDDSGSLIHISSGSERVKGILQDLFVNRLCINTTLPMIARNTIKYGNDFHLLHTDAQLGVLGWKELPVYEIERYENGMEYPYTHSYQVQGKNVDEQIDETRFVWVGQGQSTEYRNWQICHFRLLYDSSMLPYGVSYLHKARRHFRMLSMMEDMMFIYRLDRSIERRVFKINVGAIDEADVPAYVQQIADNFKRTPIIDPMTGQIDLRKNIMSQTNDYFIPVRDEGSSTPIENLPAGQNLTAMDDIKYVQNKIVTALRVPKTFLNFEEAAGDGKNLSLLDVRFMRTVNRIQQALLLELNKVATIHLLMLGFTDELTNFTLSMANPSSQAEMLELENLAKKVTTAKDAVSDPGGGMPIASMTWAWRHIFKWSDKEIQQNLEELRLETALAAELQQTNQIIKRTRLFDTVDNIYGEVGAEYGSGGQQGEGQDDGMGGGAGGGGGMPMGGDMDFGDEGEGMDMGDEGEMDMGAAADENAAMGGAEPPAGGDEGGSAPNLGEMITRQMKKKINEQKEKIYSKSEGKKLIAESKKRQDSIIEKYMSLITEDKEITNPKVKIYDRAFFMNEEMNDMINNIGKIKKEQIVD